MQEAQDDEREVLLSIYEGDSSFKQLSPKTFQYKVLRNYLISTYLYHFVKLLQYGIDDENRSFLLELTWGDNYPDDIPIINMDTFYNKDL